VPVDASSGARSRVWSGDGWQELLRLQGGAAQVQVPLLPHALVSPATSLICRCAAWLHVLSPSVTLRRGVFVSRVAGLSLLN
jgi:hypothetical protein